MKLVNVSGDLLAGLPDEDQAAIKAAIGSEVAVVGHDKAGKAEVEIVDAEGDIHTIWVHPGQLR